MPCPNNDKPGNNLHTMLKRIFTSLLIIAATQVAVFAAADNSDVMQWSERALRWSDFAGTSPLDGDASFLKTELILTSSQQQTAGKMQINLGAEARMSRSGSCAPADTMLCTRQRLRYHQLQFDLLELMRRRLQSDLNSGMTGIDADNRLKYYRNLYAEQLAAVDEETNCGKADEKLQEWEYFTRKNLEEMGLPPTPTVTPSDISYGLFIGLGGLFPTSTIKDNFNGFFTFTAGLTGGYKRLSLRAAIEYGQPKMCERNVFGVRDAAGRNLEESVNDYASTIGVQVNLGYSLIDTKRFALTPHFGIYWSSYSWNTTPLEWIESEEEPGLWLPQPNGAVVKQNIKDFNWMAGVDFDIKVHHYVSNLPFLFGKREQLTSIVRITPYVAHAVYSKSSPDLQGYQIGFKVSYVGLARALSLK